MTNHEEHCDLIKLVVDRMEKLEDIQRDTSKVLIALQTEIKLSKELLNKRYKHLSLAVSTIAVIVSIAALVR